jgi:VanZ family protein
LRRLLALVIALIVYGSLYPWRFQPRELDASPLAVVLSSWAWSLNRFVLRDLVVNVALYAPLGLTARLAFGRALPAIALGVALSLAMETLQLYVPLRRTSALDLLTNGIGAALGAALAGPFERVARARLAGRKADSGALALLGCWIAYVLFPFFPEVGLFGLRRKLDEAARAAFELAPFLSAAVSWLLAGRLLMAAGFRARWLAVAALAAPAQFAVADRPFAVSALWGAAAGCLLFALAGRRPKAAIPVAAAFAAMLAVRGLAPFHFMAEPKQFTWIPFLGFLDNDWQSAALTLLGKVFHYGAAVWALREAGARLPVAAGAVAALLAAVEAAQLWLPGRSPEIADPAIAILAGLALHWTSSRGPAR